MTKHSDDIAAIPFQFSISKVNTGIIFEWGCLYFGKDKTGKNLVTSVKKHQDISWMSQNSRLEWRSSICCDVMIQIVQYVEYI